jgi:hypothetical protein
MAGKSTAVSAVIGLLKPQEPDTPLHIIYFPDINSSQSFVRALDTTKGEKEISL